MRFRCPDTSPESSFASSSFSLVPAPNPPPNSNLESRPNRPVVKKGRQPTQPVAPVAKPARKSSSSLRRRESIPGKLKRVDSAILAAKKEQLRGDAKSKAEKKMPKRVWSFVFVGNLKPTITEEQLRARFSPCGPIIQIVIRCSSGQVTKKGLPFGPRDMRYATIEFRDSKAYLKALRLNGHLLDGVEMVVCTSPLDLPEAKEGSRPSSTPAQTPRIPHTPYDHRTKNNPTQSSPKPMTLTIGTELELQRICKPPDAPPAAEDRFRFLGLSFAKCIM
ncbi:hypothetical protein D9756_000684 [Leucocoprinus leucothites]|uniref:RRM domain-containing protein n=1 Tax=Leucocoprinus leucothites TaxID=201217 RepID=A0A8H5GFJ6_9AGAR|nr:hypothetical protein D9756_000684 [Leucoagaricus leucothites]